MFAAAARLAFGFLAHEPEKLPGPTDDWWYGPLGGNAASGVVVDEKTALSVSTVYRCVAVLCQHIAQLPLHFYRRRDGNGKDKANDHPAARLMRRPNGLQTSFEMREMLTAHMLLRGNSYFEITYGGGMQPQQLLPLVPQDVTLVQLPGGKWRYDVRMNDGGVRKLVQEQVLHVPDFSMTGGVGMSRITAMRDVLGYALALERHGSALFRNGASPKLALKVPPMQKPLSEEQIERMRRDFNAKFGGVERTGSTVLLENGMELQEYSMSNKDAEYLTSRQFQVTEICRIFGVPPHMVMDLSRSAFSNIEQQSIDFVQHSLQPLCRRIESRLNQSLLSDDDQQEYFFEFNLAGLLRGDSAARAAYFVAALTNGWMTGNEVRELENFNPLPGGDDLRTPLNTAPATGQSGAALAALLEDVVGKASHAAARAEEKGDRETARAYVTKSLEPVVTLLNSLCAQAVAVTQVAERVMQGLPVAINLWTGVSDE